MSSQHCEYATNCSLGRTFESTAPTQVTDRVCSGCTPCGTDVAVASQCNLTADTVCGAADDSADHRGPDRFSSSTSSSSGISTGDQVLIALAVFLALGVIASLFYRQRGLTETIKHQGSLQERLLEENEETRGDLEASQASNTRMLRAWQIKPADVELEDGEPMAEGGNAKVHKGLFAGHTVAIKILFKPLDHQLSPEVGEVRHFPAQFPPF